MAISKIGSRGVIDGSVLAADFAPGTITNAKLAGSIENSKLSNSTFTIGGESIALGVTDNALNLTDWQSKITSDGSTVTTMVSGRGYFVDNSSAAGLVKLPASASRGDFVQIKDYAGNFGTNNLTIQRNSHNIQGFAADSTIETNRASVTLVYVDSTKGWLYAGESNIASLSSPLFTEATGGTVTTSGDFKIHTFTSDGCFVVSQLGNSPTVPTGGPTNVDYLVVAGGGGAGNNSAGGGAGGYRTTFPSPGCNAGAFPVSAQTYPITVGAGGSHPGTSTQNGDNGSNSVFSTITSAGGGGGGAGYNGSSSSDGNDGGSGGGGGNSEGPSTGGSGNTPPVSPSQGNNGGNGTSPSSGPRGNSGGGGASAVGGNGTAPAAGNGGAGSPNSITGAATNYAGGGGGSGGGTPTSPSGSGGSGGGGAGGPHNSPSPAGAAGTANTGGGAGGGNSSNASGGSGIVIIRYKYQ